MSSPSDRRFPANHSGDSWLPLVKIASLRPEARIRASTSRAPGCTCTSSPKRWTSVPSTSRTTASTPSRRTVPLHDAVAGLDVEANHRLASRHLAQEGRHRVTDCIRCGPRRTRGDHRVHLLLRHRRPEQKLLVGHPRPELPAEILEVEGLEVAELVHAGAREHTLGDVRLDRRGRITVAAEEVANRLDRDIRPALLVAHVPEVLRVA